MTTTEKRTFSKQLPSLSGLRGISILMVIFFHYRINYSEFEAINQYQANTILESVLSVITDGLLGVNVFFVISGFLITYLLLEETKKTQTVSLKGFYIRRTLRIFPAYYSYLLFLFIIQLLGIIFIPKNSWLTAVTYTKYFTWQDDWYTGHAWSLSIEELFYLFWPLLFTLGDKIRKRSALFLVLITPFVKVLLYRYQVPKENGLFLLRWLGTIPVGCLIALYKDELLARLEKHFKSLFYCSIAGIFVLAYLHTASIKYNLHLGLFEVLLGSTTGLLANIFIGIILLYSVYGNRGLWYRFINTKVLSYIGTLSYSLYLWQQFFTRGANFWATSVPQNALFIIGTAMLSYYCIEKPFLKLKDRFHKQASKPTKETAPA